MRKDDEHALVETTNSFTTRHPAALLSARRFFAPDIPCVCLMGFIMSTFSLEMSIFFCDMTLLCLKTLG